MSLYKIGSSLRILKTAAVAEDLLIDRPLVETAPGTKIIEPKHSDFLYYRARAISAGDQGPLGKDGSRGWNYNGNFDYFPRKELEASYETFAGRNIFLDHNSESSLYSIGKIIDAVPVDDPETGEFYIELVGKIDRTLHPEICRKIETGELNSTSMGCSVDESKCSICAHVLHSDADDKCDHLSSFGLGKKFEAEIDLPEYNIHSGDMVPAFSINSGIVFNEDSIVGVPADPSAVIKTVLSNMKSRLTKKASLSKEEQLDLASQMEKLFEKLDESTKIQLKAEFCGICPPVEKESSMADKNVIPNEDQKKILSKISALEMEQLESYVTHKTKKANEVANKEVIADATSKEETFLSKIVAKVKNSFAAELLEKKIETVAKEELKKEANVASGDCDRCGTSPHTNSMGMCDTCRKNLKEISAKFQEDKNNVLDSTWSVYDGDKCLLDASLKDIWGAQFALLSFDDQKWATSEAYGKEVISRYNKEGIAKLADLWDVSHKLSKTASEPKLGPSGPRATPTTGTDNKEHNIKNSPVTKPGQESAQKGPAAPAHEDVKTDYKLDMPGQEKGQTGPAAPKPMDVKTDYSEPKPEAEGKEVKTTPKNPEEKKMEKSEKEVKTDYVAKGTEEMEAEEKGSKKESSINYKEANATIKWSSMSPEAQEFIKKHVEKHIKEDGMERAQAVAAAYSEAREKGMNVPEKKSLQETDMKKQAADKPEEAVQDKPELSKKTVGDKAEQSSQGDTEPKGTDPKKAVDEAVKKEASDKPTESVDGSTLPEGKKEIGDKPEESVKGTTLPEEGKAATPETSAQGDKEHKTPNLTKAPDEAVQDKPTEKGKDKNPDEAVKDKKEPAPSNLTKEPDMAVNKSAATEMPMPEDKPLEEVKVEEKSLDLPMDAPKVDAPKEEVSAFDKAEKLDIGEGYSAHKDPESKEIVIEKDSKEVKRLPDGFGKEVGEVLKLMKAVLGLPAAEETKPAVPSMVAPMDEHKEEPKMEEHPALEEAHEDELGLKESALKIKEAELLKKEAEITAKEEAEKKAEASRKFASILQVRSERCKKIISTLVEKDALQMDEVVYEAERKQGTHLLDARKKAFEAAITAKQKELLAMNDEALLATEKVVSDLKAPTSNNVNTKKANRLFVSPSYGEELSEDAQLKKIFDSMGTKQRPA